jgi:hypothetical protein
MALMLAILLVTVPALHGQRSTMKGYVFDSRTGQPVAFASISLNEAQAGTSTDIQGFYHLDGLMAGIYDVEIRCVGYKPLTDWIEMEEDRPAIRNFLLEPAQVELHEVKVTADQMRKREQIKVSEISILPAEIEQTPSVGGLSDIIQHLQVIPGVISRGDIGGQIYIRGGTPVQNKMLMDEAVIYNPVHSIGLFTVFDNDFIRSVNLHTGGFGAEYGGCISSVVDISTRYGNTMKLSGKADLSTIGTKILLEGPLLKDTTMENTNLSILLSAKNSHFIRAEELFYSYLDQELPFYFLDLYSKLTLLVGKSFRMNLYGFNYRDQVAYSTSLTQYNWTSTGFGGDIQLMPPRSSMVIKAYFAGSYFKMNMDEESYDPRFSDVNSLLFGFRFKKYMKNQTLNYGLEITNLGTNYSYYSTAFNAFSQEEHSTEVSGYFQYHLRIGRFMIDPGLRCQYYATLSKTSLEPRLALKFDILPNLDVKLAGGLYSQNLISAVSDRDIVNFFQGYLSAPVDLVNPGDGDVSEYYLQKSQHIIAGIDADIRKKFFFTVEGYYKYYPQLINFNKYKMLNKDQFPDMPSYLTSDFIVEEGYAEGIDVTALYDDRYRKFEIGYSYAVTKRFYDDPELGRTEYYPQYDRRHNLNLSGALKFGRNHLWEANARWNFGTGFPYTPSAGYYETVTFDEDATINHLTSNGEMGIIYGDYNSTRLPSYHRLDAAILKKFPLGKMSVIEAEFSIINIYNRKNIFYIDRRTNEQVYQLPFLPSLRVSIEF